jgi:hypothetical protein
MPFCSLGTHYYWFRTHLILCFILSHDFDLSLYRLAEQRTRPLYVFQDLQKYPLIGIPTRKTHIHSPRTHLCPYLQKLYPDALTLQPRKLSPLPLRILLPTDRGQKRIIPQPIVIIHILIPRAHRIYSLHTSSSTVCSMYQGPL